MRLWFDRINSKHEIRNSEQFSNHQNSNFRNSRPNKYDGQAGGKEFKSTKYLLVLGISIFEFWILTIEISTTSQNIDNMLVVLAL